MFAEIHLDDVAVFLAKEIAVGYNKQVSVVDGAFTASLSLPLCIFSKEREVPLALKIQLFSSRSTLVSTRKIIEPLDPMTMKRIKAQDWRNNFT